MADFVYDISGSMDGGVGEPEQEKFFPCPNFILQMNAADRELLRQAIEFAQGKLPDDIKEKIDEIRKEPYGYYQTQL